ncbi:ABC-type antimicrobial peptide transport system permease subunit [Pedobacter sp. CAN_A7]
MSAGLSCALLIYLWVNDEVQKDQFHANRLYQVMGNEHTAEGINTVDGTPGPLAEAMSMELPEIEHAVTTSPTYWLGKSKIAVGEQLAITGAGKFAGPDFFKMFSYPLLTGSADQVLTEKNTVVISESLALKLFKHTDVVGKEMVFSNTEIKNENHVLIAGVFKDLPESSSDQFDFLVSLDVLFNDGTYQKWSNSGPNTFITLKEGEDPAAFNQKISDFLKKKGQMTSTLFIRPYANSYLYDNFENGKMTGGRIDYVKLFSLIAVFILVIACINFMNLSTARASRRLKEVGIKKVMGAHRSTLILQYLAESMLLTCIALFVSLAVVELLLPQFNTLVGKELSLRFTGTLILTLLCITVFTGLLAGSYPAFYLSGLKPVLALKGKLNLTANALWTRQGLVVFQFALSILLIVAVLVVYKQIAYVQSKSQGYHKENVLYFETEGALQNKVPFILAQVKRIPGVLNASSIDRELLGDLSFTFGDFNWEGRNPKEVIKFQRAHVNADLIETLGIEMAEGRSFSDQFGSDTSKIIVNEAGIKVMRIKNPIGKIFSVWGKDLQIIGVIKDFHFESLHEPVRPMFLKYAPLRTNRIMVKASAGEVGSVIKDLQAFYAKYNPGYPFQYRFLDQDFQAQYEAENRVALLSRYFAMLAITISCLGLFGLATFTAEKRAKEIGIRKILGASGLNIIYTLSKDFAKPVMVAIVLALPLSYVLTKTWLDSFAYRIDLQLWYFVAAGVLALLLSLVTVFFQALKAVGTNPIQSIRTE